MKLCTKCGVNQPLSNFAIKVSQKDGHSWHCKSCHNKYAKGWYKKNKKLQIQKVKRYKKQKAQEYNEYKENIPCADCKKYYPSCVMDFDHVKGEKLYNISSLIHRNATKKMRNEISKCELVCSNCHRIRTFNRLK